MVEPPASSENPETVYLVDDVYHAAMLLPVNERRWVRYEFGEWHYFARNRTGFFSAVNAIAWPSDGTFGRRYISRNGGERSLSERVQGTYIFKLKVPAKRVRALLKELNRPFRKKGTERYHNKLRDLKLARVDRHYWIFHDSNAEVVDWLEKLGCNVYGSSFLSHWSVEGEKAIRLEE